MVIEGKNIVKRYDKFVALDHFNIEVEEGEIFGLLGPSGSGKTTAVNCILSLIKLDKGIVKILGEDVEVKQKGLGSKDNLKSIKRDMGVVMEAIAVFKELTVYENIQYFCSLYMKDTALIKEYTVEALKLLALEDFSDFLPKKLSEGILRRLNIACGIVHKPKLIFLDEPVSSSDPYSKSIILDTIRKLNKEGATILYASQNMEEVEGICTKILMMDKGRGIAVGTKDELKAMISTGEKITIEAYQLTKEVLEELGNIPSISDISYKDNKLEIKSKKGRNNLIHILDYVTRMGLNIGKVYTEFPTLNDVFLEITGREI